MVSNGKMLVVGLKSILRATKEDPDIVGVIQASVEILKIVSIGLWQ